MKRLLSLLLSILIMIIETTAIPTLAVEMEKISTTLTNGDYEYVVLDDGTAKITGYLGSVNEIEIPTVLNGYFVTSIGNNAFSGCKSITSLTISEKVKGIEEYAFSNCTNLEIVYFDATNCEYMDYSVFEGCSALNTVNVGDNATTIPDEAFYYCENLKNVIIGKGLTSIGYEAFDGCYNLKSVYISDLSLWCDIIFNDNPLFYAGNLYLNNNLVIDLVIPNDVVRIKEHAFSGCKSITSLTISEKVKGIEEYAFSNCTNLEIVYFDATNCEYMDYSVFEGCLALNTVNVGDKAITIPDEAFYYCENLKNVIIGKGLTSIGYEVFDGCYSLTIYGYKGSYAETYAKENNIPFITISEDDITKVDSFSTYFSDYLEPYYADMADVNMPCKTIINDGSMPSIVWNTVLESFESGVLEGGIDEKEYHEAVLLDLLANQVSSVDYEEVMVESTLDMTNTLSDYLISKGVDISKNNLNKSDLKNLWGNLQSYFLASDIELTKESYDALLTAGENTEECLDKISTYAIAMQESQNLVRAIKMMLEKSDYEVLTECLNEMATLMKAEPEEMVKYITTKEVGAKTVEVLKNYLLDAIKEAFPYVDAVIKIMEISEYGCNLIFPTTITSEQMFRIYTLYHIETVARVSFKEAYSNYQADKTVENAETVVSCYDMFVRVYEHEIAECNALAEILYKKGALNGIKNFFSTNNMNDYQAAVDWVYSYNVNLDTIKEYKECAYVERGVNLDLLKPVRFISVVDGKIAGYNYQFVNTGNKITIPDHSFINSSKFSMNKVVKNLGTFEGWYYDEACTKPCTATSIVVNEPVALYSKFSMKSGKFLQVKCPIDIKVFDNDNGLVLNIVNNKVISNPQDLYVEITNSCKMLFLPDNCDYTVNLIAFDSGSMNYSVTEVSNGMYNRKINFNNISLYTGQKFDGVIHQEQNLSKDLYTLNTITVDDEKKTVFPDEIFENSEMQSLDVSVVADGNGSVTNGSLVTKGDYYIVSATPDKGQRFIGWYVDDKLVSTDKSYGFIVEKDTEIKAKFVATTVKLAIKQATIYLKGTTKIKATVSNGVGKTKYKSSNTKVATVTTNGKVLAKKAGTTKITVTNNGVSKSLKVTVKKPFLNKMSKTLRVGKIFKIKIKGQVGKAKFISSNKKIAKVNSKGLITAKKKGNVTIKVKTNGITLKCKVKVKK